MRTIKFLVFSGLILVLTNCKNQTSSNVDRLILTNSMVKNADLIKLFKVIDPNVLHVWAKFDKPGGDKYQGSKIDTIYFPLFGDYMNQYKQYYIDPKTNITSYSGYFLFASFKFTINDFLTGLIVRTPSQYEESAITLWIYDSKKDRLVKSVELADGFGDENWYFNLVRSNSSKLCFEN